MFPVSVLGFVPLIVLLAPGLVLTASIAGTFLGLVLLAAATMTGRRLGAAHRWWRRPSWERTWRRAPFVCRRPRDPRPDRCPAAGRDRAGSPVAYVVLQAAAGLLGAVLHGGALARRPVLPHLSAVVADLPARGPGRDGRLHPLPISTPFPAGGERVTTFGGALLICLLGIGVLLIAPWTTRLPVIVDMWLMRALLGESGRSERIRELEASRARLVDDSAALLRRVERNLHDGAQARLVALTMHLGRATEQLGTDGEPGDLDRARDLMAAAQQDARAALTELRDLARGIHPPALDAGLEDALASLAAASATPVAADGRHPGPAHPGHRDHRLLLRGRVAD